MTISSSTAKSGPYAGNGVTVVFAISFACYAAADLTVVRTDPAGADTTLTLATDYTVSLNVDQTNSPGGTITMTAAPATGYQVTILRNVQMTQGSSFPNQGGWYPQVVEKALDKLTMIVQQLQEKLSRSVTLGVTQTDPTAVINAITTGASVAAASAASATASASSAASSATSASGNATSASGSATAAASSASAAAASAASANVGDHEVVIVGGTGMASTNTAVRALTTIQSSVGTAITGAVSATLGASCTINQNGLYAISYTDTPTSQGWQGVSVNSNQLTTNVSSIADANRLAAINPLGSTTNNCSRVVRLSAGDIVRPHAYPGATFTSTIAAAQNIFSIRKVGN
jgi:hypothetical protein